MAIKDKKFDIILVNINRNILLQDMHVYVEVLKENGNIYFSGFYEKDFKILKDKAREHGLNFINKKSKNPWVAAHFKKKING